MFLPIINNHFEFFFLLPGRFCCGIKAVEQHERRKRINTTKENKEGNYQESVVSAFP